MAAFFARLWDLLAHWSMRVIFPFGVVISIFLFWHEFLIDQFAQIALQLLNYQIPGADFSLADTYVPLARINRIIPLFEFVVCAGIYYGIAMVVILFRWIKSFVPTLSN